MRIGPVWISEYTLALWLGIGLAMIWLAWAAPRYGIAYKVWSRWAVVAALTAVIAGRAGYVLLHEAYFRQNPTAVWHLRQTPGIHGSSAAAGVLMLGLLSMRRSPHRLSALLVVLGSASLYVAAGAWLGCLHTGCAWGQEVTPMALPVWARWTTAHLHDLYRISADRYAVQALGACWALALAALAVLWPSVRLWVFPIYLVGQAALALLRADPVSKIAGLRGDMVLDVVLAGGWAIAAALCGRRALGKTSS